MKELTELGGVVLRLDGPPIDPARVTVPDLGYISLIIGESENGFGMPIDNSNVIQEYQADLTVLVEALNKTGRPPKDFELFVPNFWHVAYGRAKDLTEEDGALLWASTVFGTRIVEQFFGGGPVTAAFRHNLPGSLYRVSD